MRVTLSEMNVSDLAAAFGDFTKADINEIIAKVLAERNAFKSCLSGGLQAAPVQAINNSPAPVLQEAATYNPPPADLGEFAGLLGATAA